MILLREVDPEPWRFASLMIFFVSLSMITLSVDYVNSIG